MNRHSDCIQLFEISLDSLRKYVGETCVMFLETYQSGGYKETLQVADKACSQFRNLIHGTLLPPQLADEVTCALLDQILTTISCPSFEMWAPEVFLQLIDSVLHPQATRIILQPEPVHSNFFSKFRRNRIQLVVRNLNFNTRVLRLGEVVPHIDFNWNLFPKHLEELTIEDYLSDETLEIVVDSCKELTILNVTHSISISDKSVDIILKLKLLQALYIGRTCITKDGVEKLLLGLSRNEANRSIDLPFTCFGGLYDTNIKTLVENLPNISELTLCYKYDSALLHLTKLKHLQSLSLRTDHANNIPSAGFFYSLGKQLTCLDFENFQMIDIKCIGENCHTLKCLHISGNAIFDTEIPVTDELIESSRISGLLSVECLCVEIPDDILGTLVIISQCVNVRRLFVSLYGITLEEVLEKVSKYNKMEFLETLCMSPWFFITPEFANYLREKYKNLRACYGDVFGVKRSCGIRFYDWYM